MGRVLLVVFAALSMAASARAAYWHTDFGEAQTRAYGENRTMLIYFERSDDDALCERLQRNVFSTYEFQTFADRHLVLMEVDFPRWKQLHPTQVKINKDLSEKYRAYGWPVVVIANNRGQPLGQIGYKEGGPAAFMAAIEQIAKLSEKEKPADRTSDPPPLFSGAPTGPGPKYNELALKSISGTGAKRLALINNVTLAAGESGKVRLGQGEVKIRCEEIRDASVIVTVDGKPEQRELRLLPPEAKAPQQANSK